MSNLNLKFFLIGIISLNVSLEEESFSNSLNIPTSFSETSLTFFQIPDLLSKEQCDKKIIIISVFSIFIFFLKYFIYLIFLWLVGLN